MNMTFNVYYMLERPEISINIFTRRIKTLLTIYTSCCSRPNFNFESVFALLLNSRWSWSQKVGTTHMCTVDLSYEALIC